MAYDGNYYNAYVGNDEIFNHRLTTTPFRMDLPEIFEPPEHQAYHNHGYDNQVPQFYFNNGHGNHDRRDYDHNDRSYRGTYAPDPMRFRMDRQELSNRRISVRICLSSMDEFVNTRLMSTLSQRHDLSCSCAGNVLTVTGYHSSSSDREGAIELLNTVRDYDPQADFFQRRR